MVDSEVVGIEEPRIRGGPEGRVAPFGIDPVASLRLCQYRLVCDVLSPVPHFLPTPAGPLLRGTQQVDFQAGFRQHHGADIPADHDHPAVRGQIALLGHHGFPDLSDPRDKGYVLFHLWVPQFGANLVARHLHHGAVAVDQTHRVRPGQFAQGPCIVDVGTAMKHQPGYGPVHNPSIDKGETQPPRQGPADDCFAGGHRTVDCYHAVLARHFAPGDGGATGLCRGFRHYSIAAEG